MSVFYVKKKFVGKKSRSGKTYNSSGFTQQGVDSINDISRGQQTNSNEFYDQQNVKEYDSASSFPQTGNGNVIYVSRETNELYRYDEETSQYVIICAMTAGDGIDIQDGVISNTHTFLTSSEITEIINS